MPTTSPAPTNGKWDASTTFYTIKNAKGNFLNGDVTGGTTNYLVLNSNATPTENGYWAVVGDNTNGYSFYNYGTGKILSMTSDDDTNEANSYAFLKNVSDVTSGEETKFTFVASKKSNYWCLKVHGSTNSYWTQHDQQGQRLGYWFSDWAVEGWKNSGTGDDGCAFFFEKVEVELPTMPTVITQLSELSNNKAYTATLPNHSKGANGWAVNDTNLKSLYDLSLSQKDSDPNQQFAFLTPDNGTTYYLYSVGKSKYISNTGALTDNPTHPIVFKDGNRTGTFVVWYDADHIVNVGGDKQMTIDDWGPDGGQGFADVGNSIVITAVEDFNPEDALRFFAVDTDRSEELAPNFGKVDEAVKVNDACGTYLNEQYGGYKNWESDKVSSKWNKKENGVDIFETTPLVSISAFRYDSKEESPRLYTDGEGAHTMRFALTNNLTGMTLKAAEGYSIVGYCFDYTTANAISDDSTIEGEITCAAAGTHHIEVKSIETVSTDIYFGQQQRAGEVTISNFYVFLKKGTILTQEELDKLVQDYYYIDKVFTLTAKAYPNSNLYAPQDKNMLDMCDVKCSKYNNVKATAKDPAQQFMLVPFDSFYSKYQTKYEGCFFLYNLGAGKFVSKEGKYTTLTEHPRQVVSIEEGSGDYSGYFKISFNKENLLNASHGYCKENDEATSCIVTNWNTLDDGNHFEIRIVRNLAEEAGSLMDGLIEDMTKIKDASIIESKVAEIQALLDKDGVGYPITQYHEILKAYKEDLSNYGIQITLFDLEYFLPEYKSTTSVKMPQNGKAYRIKTHYMGTLGRYLKAAEGGVLSVVNEGQHKTDNTTVFVARSIDEAANGEGTFAFVGENGQFLVGARTGTQGFVPTYNDGGNTGDLCVSTAANKGDYFGGFILKTTEGTNTYNLQLGATGTGTNLGLIYDAENPNSIINDPNGGSSIFFLEEVNDYPNVVKLREPAVADGKAYSSIWLPFSVEIPEGVRAYKAHIDYTTNQLVCGEVKNILPGGEGAILISEEAQEIVLAPATADVVPLQDNDLKGTNVTLARNTGVTTFVLNGGKGEIGFYPYTGENIAKYKAYVEVDKAQAAQGLRFSFGTATDIENTLTEGEGEAKEYYDLSGRRVAQPTKGLYIVNGKKMYIK